MKQLSNLSLCSLMVALFLLVGTLGCDKSDTPAKSTSPEQNDQKSTQDKKLPTENTDGKTEEGTGTKVDSDLSDPVSLFDGESLDLWDIIEFGGEGDIYAEDGLISFEMGDPMTGISYSKEDLPKTNYEVSLEARKTQGVDFFCGLTFPVAESHCTLILGGWGGDICGLSCIDDQDASRNDTTKSIVFKKNQWYKIRLRVEPNKILAWLDGKQIVDSDITGRTVSLRGDTTLCAPLGICSFQTNADYKNIELRKIKTTSGQGGSEKKSD